MKALLRKRGKALVCLFFLAVLLLGLCTVGDYGRYWDELSELSIFRMSIMEYAETLPFLGGLRQTLTDMGVTPLSQSVEMDHNVSLYYPLAGFASDPALDVNDLSMIWRGYTWAVFVFGLYCLYAVCRRMGLSRPLCCAAVLLLLLSPRLFAQGHYNNKDIPLMTLTGFVLWQTLRLAEKPTVSRGLLFALAAGLCVNTRVIGGAICALCGGLVVIKLWAEGRLTRKAWGAGAAALLGALLCYALLTPALLRDPLGYLSYVVKSSVYFARWNGTMLFMGRELDMASGKPPFYYLPVMIALTTPLLQLGLTLFGGGATVRALFPRGRAQAGQAAPADGAEPGGSVPEENASKAGLCRGSAGSPSAPGGKRCLSSRLAGLMSWDEGEFAALASLLLWLLPLLCAVVLRVRIYNGWRHFYFLALPMAASAAWGLKRLWQWAAPRAVLRRAVAAGLACVLAAQAGLLMANHPNQYAYYNPLVSRNGLEERYELDYWNLSVFQALRQLEALAGDQEPIPVACTDRRTRSGFSLALSRMPEAERQRFRLTEYEAENRSAFYTLANTSYLALDGLTLPADLRPVVTVQAYGATLCTVYVCQPEEVSP